MPEALIDAARARDDLKSWLLREAYPLWWQRGIDRVHGGFHEKLTLSGEPIVAPRRFRVQPRQIYAYAVAGMLGWDGAYHEAVEQGLSFQLGRYRRSDGLFYTLVAPDGAPLDLNAVLYDQAFALLGLASAYTMLRGRDDLKTIALHLRSHLRQEIEQPGSFDQRPPAPAVVSANSHMHLFEACLAWHDAEGDASWLVMADEIVRFAMTRFIDPNLGALHEFFTSDWKPAPGLDGRIVEPGHQFEWAWLLLRWVERAECPEAVEVALRLIQLGEEHGVDRARGVAMNVLLDDLSVHDSGARLWPQTERLKAACAAAVATGDERYWRIAVESAQALRRYFETPLPGLWRDRMNADGSFVDEPAPASSFYHIVCAIAELDRTITLSVST